MKRTRNLKLPNGFGSIVYLGNNRRRPYGAIKTIGWTDEKKQNKKYIGYAETWNEAYKILLEYNNSPYDLINKNITLGETYEKLLVKLENDYDNGIISKSTLSCLKSSYNGYLRKLENRPILELRKKEIQDIINDSKLKYTGRNYIKILFTRIIKFGNDDLELNINENIYKDLKVGEKEKSNLHKPFTIEEVNIIQNLASSNDIAKMLMIYFYSGLRPSELLLIKTKDIHLDENYMIGGIKTKYSINRIIPIHSFIKEYIEYFYNSENKFLINKMNYDMYQNRFENLMNSLNMNHTPHDTRHTFATRADEVNIPLPIIKLLLGHSLANDVTNDVYIHKNLNSLLMEIEKIRYI